MIDDLATILSMISKIVESEMTSKSQVNPNADSLISSPKIDRICGYLNELNTMSLQHKKAKILIILSRNTSYLLDKINESVLKETNFQSRVYDILMDQNANRSVIENHDCLIVSNNVYLYSNLKEFTHVINYEPQLIQVNSI